MSKLKLNIQRFSATNHTAHYNLSQYISTDKPTYLVDYNSDMLAIDTAIYNAMSKATVNESNIGTMENLTTTAKTDLVSALNEVNSQVGTNTSNISQNTSDISTLGTNQGDLANLTTTSKSNLVSAINEVKSVNDTQTNNIGDLTELKTSDKTNLVGALNEIGSLLNFTDFETVSNSNITISGNAGGQLQSDTFIKLAYNSDKSIFKVYGRIGIGSVSNTSSTDWKITFPTQLRPAQEYTIEGACMHAQQATAYLSNSQYPLSGIAVDKITVKTNGNIEITNGAQQLGRNAYFYIPPCIYINKSFGD